MKDQIYRLLEAYDPRVFSQKLKSQHPEAYQWILDHTPDSRHYKNFKERTYLALNSDAVTVCEHGKEKKFVSLSEGYGFCGTIKSCKCNKEHLSTFQSTRDIESMLSNREKTWIEKYGTDNPMKVKSIANAVQQNRKKSTNSEVMRSYGYESVLDRVTDVVQPSFTKDDYLGCSYKNKYPWVCNECQTQFEDHVDNGNSPRCPQCYPKRVSLGECELSDFVKSLGVRVENNVVFHDIKREIDIFLPEQNIGIEYNGVYWHSSAHKDKNYHLNKTRVFHEKGIRIIHVWSDEWETKRTIVANRLRSVLHKNSHRTYARKCQTVCIQHHTYKEFCEGTHLRGWAPASIKYGLMHQDQLVAVMSFSNSRYTKDSYELVRYCSIGNVIGGASKLFSHFVKNHEPTSVVSYADRSWNTGNLYHKLGFHLVSETKPCYWYIDRNKRYHRSSFQKKALVAGGFDPHKTEQSIMQERGYQIVYDCGHYKFIWT